MLIPVLTCIHRAAVNHDPILGYCRYRTEKKPRQQNPHPLHPSDHGSSSLQLLSARFAEAPRGNGRAANERSRWGVRLKMREDLSIRETAYKAAPPGERLRDRSTNAYPPPCRGHQEIAIDVSRQTANIGRL